MVPTGSRLVSGGRKKAMATGDKRDSVDEQNDMDDNDDGEREDGDEGEESGESPYQSDEDDGEVETVATSGAHSAAAKAPVTGHNKSAEAKNAEDKPHISDIVRFLGKGLGWEVVQKGDYRRQRPAPPPQIEADVGSIWVIKDDGEYKALVSAEDCAKYKSMKAATSSAAAEDVTTDAKHAAAGAKAALPTGCAACHSNGGYCDTHPKEKAKTMPTKGAKTPAKAPATGNHHHKKGDIQYHVQHKNNGW
jgi:hypothetical protein